ncbi:uncharacterized protein J8A68_005842 [[Candida] subhashii]|uniref:Trafficking protein particle complex subunit 11 domain-containing protein n=1 Tax=[Candida] subhashii TaxID=561895 RepID=A0A8J5Q521_9ASCO|nr:uncharacterized protein J8A68_005842 [[Candida] subhashii]KAG7660576.1 hypothetical protein J8A68_005842 [[Candida] subhashii]
MTIKESSKEGIQQEMENYNKLYLQQLDPFIKVHFQSSLKGTELSKTLIKHFDQFNVHGKVWDNSIIRNRLSSDKFIIQIETGDQVSFPEKQSKIQQPHSILSPFNENSTLFPNGILDHLWFDKYINIVPFNLIYICELGEVEDTPQFVRFINDLNAQLNSMGTNLTVIVCSEDLPEDTRLQSLRQATGLTTTSTGIIYLQNQKVTLERDIEMLVSSLLPSLKNVAHNFYTNIERKIDQRNKKYYSFPTSIDNVDTSIELTPKFLETRNILKRAIMFEFINPHNLEEPTRLLEISYQNLSIILNTCYNNNLSDHDRNTIGQFRILLDVITFHIVRSYLSAEEPLRALKIHKSHITNIAGIIGLDKNWICTQYEWLAELMKLIPASILSDLSNSTIVKQQDHYNRNRGTMVAFFGGIQLPEFDVITNPGLIYLKAYGYIESSDRLRKIKNLEAALEELDKGHSMIPPGAHGSVDEGGDEISSLVSYVNWLLGEEYFARGNDGDILKASEYYEIAYSIIGPSEWPEISWLILSRLVQCYSACKNKKQELITMLRLSLISQKSRYAPSRGIVSISKDIFSEKEIELDIIEPNFPDLFDIDILLVNDLLKHETSVHDKCTLQVCIKSLVNKQTLKSILGTEDDDGNIDIKVIINQMDVHYTRNDARSNKIGFKGVSITNDSRKPIIDIYSIKGQELEHTFVDSINLEFQDTYETKTIQHSQHATTSGLFQVDSIKLQISIHLITNTNIIRLNKIELHNSFNSSYHHGKFYIDGRRKFKQVRLNGPSHSIRVYPVRPDICVTLITPEINCFISGEKLAIPLRIEYKNKQFNKRAQLIAKVKGGGNSDNMQVNWDGLKDDEPLDLLTIEGDEHVLYVFARDTTDSLLTIDIQTAVYEEEEEQEGEGEVVVYDTAVYTFPILKSPFNCRYSIKPAYRDWMNDMPSPFILTSATERSMPIAVRTWQGKLELIDQFESNKYGERLIVEDIEFSISSKNAEVLVDLASKEEETKDIFSQLFTTKSKSGFSHRNVIVVNSAIVNWRRHGDLKTSPINTFVTPEWEIPLPLSEPRLLFRIEPEEEKGIAKLQYILENPTPRIFNFTTQMVGLEGWSFEDERNSIPLKQNPFPVLPFSRHIMDFYGKFDSKNDRIRLPQFKCFDVQYKVGLPTLAIMNNIILQNDNLYWYI